MMPPVTVPDIFAWVKFPPGPSLFAVPVPLKLAIPETIVAVMEVVFPCPAHHELLALAPIHIRHEEGNIGKVDG